MNSLMTFQIKAKEIYVNGKQLDQPKNLSFNYNVQSAIELNFDTLQKYQISEGGRVEGINKWQLTLSETSLKLTKFPLRKPSPFTSSPSLLFSKSI